MEKRKRKHFTCTRSVKTIKINIILGKIKVREKRNCVKFPNWFTKGDEWGRKIVAE